jgi:hypothetical protein
MPKNLFITIGDVCISIEGDPPNPSREIPRAYQPFIATGSPEIRLRMHLGTPETSGEKKLFDSSPIWTLHRQGKGFVIKIYENIEGGEQILFIPPDFRKADFYLTGPGGSFKDLFYGPTLELLMVNYLAQDAGVIVHACGINRHGRGILFVGESGAGKSTLAKLWDQEKGIDILSDDRIIVRKKAGQFWMYGTPWHGEAKFVSDKGVRLEKIFFLQHDQKNSIKDVHGTSPILQFLKASFPPFWDAKGVEFTLEFLNDLVVSLPCRELSFTPDRSVIDYIKAQGTRHKA